MDPIDYVIEINNGERVKIFSFMRVKVFVKDHSRLKLD